MINKHGEEWAETHGDDDTVWIEASGGNKHGDIYMLGSVVDSKKLKKRRCTTSSSIGGRWVRQEEFDKLREANRMHEEQHEKDRQEIELLRKQQEEQEKWSHVLEEQQLRDREELDRVSMQLEESNTLSLQMLEMMRDHKESSTLLGTQPRRTVKPPPHRPTRHEQLFACRNMGETTSNDSTNG